MTTESLEQTIKDMQLQIERLQAARTIENMFSRYEYYHANEQHDKVIAMFSKRPDTRLYFGELGYWESSDAAERGWATLKERDVQPGEMHFHPTMCPVIEVAEDGQTAQCAWTTFGFETAPGRPAYSWGTYGVDCIKEEGEWKFWHFHIYRLLIHEEGKPWTDKNNWDPFPEKPREGGLKVTTDFPGVDDYPYQIDKITVIKPDPPLPYKTISDVKCS